MRDRRAVPRDRVTAGRGHLVSLDLASLDAVPRPWPNGRILHLVVRCSPRTLASLQGQ